MESCGDCFLGRLLDNPEDLSDCEPDSCAHVRVVPDVTDVFVSPSSVVTELCDWEFVEPLSFFFLQTACTLWCRYAGRGEVLRLTSESTPVQNSYTSFVRDHGRYEEEGRGWNARERTIIARTKQFLERSFSVKVQVEAPEALLGPEDVDVDLRRILKEVRDERGRHIFETFGSNDMSFLVAEWSKMGQTQKRTMEARFVGLCKR